MVFPLLGADMTIARAAERAAASTLSRLSCLTWVKMWWRFALANSKMNFLTCVGFVRLLLMVCGGSLWFILPPNLGDEKGSVIAKY